MKIGNVLKWAVFLRYAYILGKEKAIQALNKLSLEDAFDFELSRVYQIRINWNQKTIDLLIDLWVINNTSLPFQKADGYIKLTQLVIFYKNKKIGQADLNQFPLSFRPHERKLVRGIPVKLYVGDFQLLKEIAGRWPDIELTYKVTFNIANKNFEYENTYNLKNFTS